MNLTTTESIRTLRQLQLDSAKTQIERNKLGQFATPTALAADIFKYAKTLLLSDQKIRFLDPAFGTGAFYSALLQQFPSLQIVKAIAYEINPHYGDEAIELWRDTPLQLNIATSWPNGKVERLQVTSTYRLKILNSPLHQNC
jgi:hypothetical protein